MPPSVGASAGTSVARRPTGAAPKPTPTPANAAQQRVARGARLRSTTSKSNDSDHEADQLADREAAGGGPVDHLARHRDVDAGVSEPRGRVLEPLTGRAPRSSAGWS